jgi:hypothetical protein
MTTECVECGVNVGEVCRACCGDAERLKAQRDRWREAIRQAVQSIRWGGVVVPMTTLEKLLGEDDR